MVLSCAATTSLSGNIDASHTIQCRPRSNGPRSGPIQSGGLPSEEIGKENPGAGLCGYERYGADLGSWSPSTTNKNPNHRYLHMGGTLLLDGSHSGSQVHGEGPGTLCVPGHDCSGREELRCRPLAMGQQFRRGTQARKDLNWSITDHHLYNEAFYGKGTFDSESAHSVCMTITLVSILSPKRPWLG